MVYKVARLGRFDQRELTLRPGTYTAVGTRRGFRDVRHEFKVGHEGAPPSLPGAPFLAASVLMAISWMIYAGRVRRPAPANAQ